MRWSLRSFKIFVYKHVSRVKWGLIPIPIRVWAVEKYTVAMRENIERDISTQTAEYKNIMGTVNKLKNKENDNRMRILSDLSEFDELYDVINYFQSNTKAKTLTERARLLRIKIHKKENEAIMKRRIIDDRKESKKNMTKKLDEFMAKEDHSALDEELAEYYSVINNDFKFEKKTSAIGEKSKDEQEVINRLNSGDEELQDIVKMEQTKESDESAKFAKEFAASMISAWQENTNGGSKKAKKTSSSSSKNKDVEVYEEDDEDDLLLKVESSNSKRKSKHPKNRENAIIIV